LSRPVVKVTGGCLLVSLSNIESESCRNLPLLKNRSWFDVPLVYVNSAAPSSPFRKMRPRRTRIQGRVRGVGSRRASC
jgi:hypothetical protein